MPDDELGEPVLLNLEVKPRTEMIHAYCYHNKGYKQQSKHGYIYCPLPDHFLRVCYRGVVFKYVVSNVPWDSHGYYPQEDSFIPPDDGQAITDQQLRQGYYLSKPRLDRTPADWLYVEWQGGQAFVAPSAVHDLVHDQSIPRLTRGRLSGE